MPRSTRICAPMPYSRFSAGRPSASFASTVSQALVLQPIGANLVVQPDATALLIHVHDRAAALRRHPRHRRLQLIAAVAALRAEDVAGHALIVNAHQRRLVRAEVAHHERHVLLVVDQGAVADHPELAEAAGQRRLLHALDQPFVRQPVGDDVGDGDDAQVVLAGQPLQVRHPGHRAVVLHHLADHRRRVQPGEIAEIPRRLPSGRRAPAPRRRVRAAGRCAPAA